MRSFWLVWVAALLGTVVGAWPVPPGRPAIAQVSLGATLSVLAPVVEVASAGGAFSPARNGQTLLAGDEVRTGPAGVALLTFFDGSETQLTSDSRIQIDAADRASVISVFQLSGTSVSRVRAPSSTGGFQTDTPPATALVRGTTYVVTVVPTPRPLARTECARTDILACVSSAILLADPDGRVGRLGMLGRSGGTVELTKACDVGAAASLTRLSVLDPTTCAQLQQSVLDLRDPLAAATTRAIGQRTNATVGPSASPPGGGGGSGGGNATGGGGGAPGGAPGPPPQGNAVADGSGADDAGLIAGAAGGMEVAYIVASSSAPTRFGVGEGYRNPVAMADSGATWQRLVIGWRAVQPNGPDDFSNLGRTLPADELQAEIGRGVKLTGLLQFTPRWAAAHPELGERSPPKNLDLPFDDPNNYWGRFVYETAKFYAGQIDEWIVWNEPEFKPTDPGAGNSATWLGTDEEFARLLQVAYQAIKRANPNAVVSFPGTSYWVEQNLNRSQFYERMLAILARQPDAARNHFYHDVLALNLYRNPDDVLRVHNTFKAIQRKFGLETPIWLTETNAMPTDDPTLGPCAHAGDIIQTSLEQQAAFAIQAFAMAAASGYARAGFYQMVDDNACLQPAVWGAVRDDGSRRPVADALRTAIHQFGGVIRARFAPLEHAQESWPVWPADPASYWPNWQVYQVVLDFAGGRRVTVLWNADDAEVCIKVPRSGVGGAQLIDKRGISSAAMSEGGRWQVQLSPASAHFADDPVGYHFIGGDPMLLIEEGVSPEAPIGAPALTCGA